MKKERDFNKISEIMKEATGVALGYAYTDLAFSEHGLYMIHFVENGDDTLLYCYFNLECLDYVQEMMQPKLMDKFTSEGYKIQYKGQYQLIEKGNSKGEFEIKLFEE